jgi:pimeloyl-ACP methyl ester carboxylesterase
MASVTVNNVKLAYADVGAGPAVVWVHGSWTNRHGADRLAARLAEQYRVITYDRRGHSESERPPGHVTVDTHATDLAGLIEHLGAAPAHLVANSFGGGVALKLAAQRPDLVASLCLHEPPVARTFAHDPEIKIGLDTEWSRIEAVIAEIEQGDPEVAARHFVEAVAMGRGAWAGLPAQTRQTFIYNAPTFLPDSTEEARGLLDTAELASISVPVLLTVGGQTPPEFAASRVIACLAAAIPNARQHTFPDAGHVPHLTHLDELVRVVTEFLATTERGASHRP